MHREGRDRQAADGGGQWRGDGEQVLIQIQKIQNTNTKKYKIQIQKIQNTNTKNTKYKYKKIQNANTKKYKIQNTRSRF